MGCVTNVGQVMTRQCPHDSNPVFPIQTIQSTALRVLETVVGSETNLRGWGTVRWHSGFLGHYSMIPYLIP